MLARLVVGSTSLATGCLVAEAPEYGPAQQRPPVVGWENVKPSPYELQTIDETLGSLDIRVPVRSEDAGDPLQGVLWVDYGNVSSRKRFDEKQVPASSFDDLERAYSTTWIWDERVKKECGHTLTLLLMHRSNYDDDKDIPNENVEWDVASVTWQMNVFPKELGIIQVCPSTTTAATP
ncbi:MAG TPA: hypothetical protein VMS65_17010 [Polyangiaceae bacterium]|nr:hypothetical protein [Polyangiaceae bacterium]